MSELMIDKMDNVSALVHERGKIYGHPCEDFERVSTMVYYLKDCKDLQLRHVMYMICVKLARLIVTPSHADSWMDIVGYCRTAAMVIDRRNQESIK